MTTLEVLALVACQALIEEQSLKHGAVQVDLPPMRRERRDSRDSGASLAALVFDSDSDSDDAAAGDCSDSGSDSGSDSWQPRSDTLRSVAPSLLSTSNARANNSNCTAATAAGSRARTHSLSFHPYSSALAAHVPSARPRSASLPSATLVAAPHLSVVGSPTATAAATPTPTPADAADAAEPAVPRRRQSLKSPSTYSFTSALVPLKPRANFTHDVLDTLTSWLKNNIENPYPTIEEKHKLASQCALNMKQ
ncbi:hypothetical protein HK100_005990, partial [Physocladia obscura]